MHIERKRIAADNIILRLDFNTETMMGHKLLSESPETFSIINTMLEICLDHIEAEMSMLLQRRREDAGEDFGKYSSL